MKGYGFGDLSVRLELSASALAFIFLVHSHRAFRYLKGRGRNHFISFMISFI